MKKWYALGVTVALIFTVTAVSAQFGSLSSKVPSTVKDIAAGAAKKKMNDELSSNFVGCKCVYNKKTKGHQLKNCSAKISKANKIISNYKNGVKIALNRTFRIRAEVNRGCYDELHAGISADPSYWRWYNAKYIKTDTVRVWGE